MSELVDETQTQEERIAWLRERNVEIEFPSDRRTRPAPSSSFSSSSSGDGTTRTKTIKIVKIPCCSSESYQELSISVDADKIGDQLTELLRIYFNRGGQSIRIDEVKDLASNQFSNQDVNISQRTIDQLSSAGSVEVFPIAQPVQENSSTKVSFYLDEAGQLKRLQPNERASQLARLCGFKNVSFVGDLFVGRTRIITAAAATKVEHLDFLLCELDSGSEWLRDVEAHNYRYGVAHNRVTMDQQAYEPDAEEEPNRAVSTCKELRWTETKDYLELSLSLPAAIKRFTAKDLQVQLRADRVEVRIRNTSGAALQQSFCLSPTGGASSSSISSSAQQVAPNELVLLWEGRLHGSISVEDSTWCINGHTVELSLEKTSSSQGLWKKLEATTHS